MAVKEIMLVCAAGMSTSLLVTKMQQAAETENLAVHIVAVPVPEATVYLQQESVDVLLLGPQVRYMLAEFESTLAEKGIPVAVIPMTDYGMMRGDKVLALAKSLMESPK